MKRSSYYTEIFSPFLYAFAGIFLRFSNLFSLSGKMASYYTDKKQAFFEGVFRKVYKLFKNAPSPESDPPTIRRKTRCFYGNLAKNFSFFATLPAVWKKILLLYAQKAGVLIAHFSKLFFLFRWNVCSILKGKCSKRKRTTSIFEHSVRIEWFVKSMQSCPQKRTCYVWTIDTICDTMLMLIESKARPVIHGGIYG